MSGFVKIAMDEYYSQSNWTSLAMRYWTLMDHISDPRVEGWFLMDNPIPTIVMVIVYLAIVLVFGPLSMADRKPYNLKNTLIVYNAFQVALSAYMFYEHLMSGWLFEYNLTCQPVDYSNSPTAIRMLTLCWVYYLSKLSEFADTFFFILRKKRSQVTWLHIYHHSITPLETWFLVKFLAGGHTTSANIVNNFVHVCMYLYYMVAAMGPQYQKYLWWKKYLTKLQLAQFVICFLHSLCAFVSDCDFPMIVSGALMLNNAIFFALFMNFYKGSYGTKTAAVAQKKID